MNPKVKAAMAYRMPHEVCDDSWYSCPASGECLRVEIEGKDSDVCECYASVVNPKIELLATELQKYHDALESMVYQFAYDADNPPRLLTGGLSALEEAFEVLGWESPHPVPERGCQMPACQLMATCGTPTPDGYKWVCGPHMDMLRPVRDK